MRAPAAAQDRPPTRVDLSGRVAGGLDFLTGMSPQEVYLLYDGGSAIRVYTKWYAEALATGRVRLPPVITW